MKRIFMTLLIFFGALGAEAQSPIGVAVKTGNSVEQNITDQFKAKIGGTSRYALSQSPVPPLAVEVWCIPLLKSNGSRFGYACDSEVTYFPGMGALSTQLVGAGTLVSCSTDGGQCAEVLFELFVRGTQPENLATAKSQLRARVNHYLQLVQAKK